jgi:hypothetical protein
MSFFRSKIADSNTKSTMGFAAFAGTQSFFGRTVDSSSPPVEKSIWGCSADSQCQVSQDPLTAETHSKSAYTRKFLIKALSFLILTDSGIGVYLDLTGEEGEDVESELKGVKLFVNRGHKGFNDGIFGHVKLLSNKETKSERLRELAIEIP